jgi:choline dehydrogenase-like flavoprotein
VASKEWELDLKNKTINIMSFGLIDLNPRSKGTIMASHSDPEALPSFSFNPLQLDKNDLEFLVDQYINMYNIIQEAKSHNSGIHDVVFPPEEIFKKPEADKRRLLGDFVRASYSNFFHYGGQCRMAQSIHDGVVNGHLDVFGTVNLKIG